MAIAAGVKPLAGSKEGTLDTNTVVPLLFDNTLPDWFTGIAFAAVGIGALVPAAIMSIAAANLYSRNIHREFFRPDCSEREQSQVAKWVSLIVKFGALAFIVLVPQEYAIQLQLLGGIWMIQTLPAVIVGLYTRWFDDWALLIGWAAGIGTGTWMAVKVNFTAIYPLTIAGFTMPGYSALYTVILNLAVTAALTLLFRAIRRTPPYDETVATDYRDK
jgi:SSS family solute:Na+ symporter